MFTNEALEQAIADFRKEADTPAKKILVEFLEAHIADIKVYQPRMAVLDETLEIVRRRRRTDKAAEQKVV
ncbi:MAG: hypothetical protein H6669_07535 [Ardenticatenaceae bacterium]|nr:hypothetical protein [Ardenticatenaceae bacterium]